MKALLAAPFVVVSIVSTPFAVTLAGVPDGAAPWWMPLVNTGAMGIFCVWFMFVVWPGISELAKSVDRVARILITLSLAVAQNLAHCEAIQAQCEAYEKELNDADARRKK